MGKPLNLAGQRFGRLTVLDESKSEKGNRYWKCRCDCGNEVWVRANILKSGKTRSCGCLAIDTASEKYHDIRGQKFGRLTVLDEPPRTKDGVLGKIWHCRCDCGNEVWVQSGLLVSGKTLSCGCLQREKASEANFKDLRGQKFGKLTVLDEPPRFKERKNASRRTLWHCKCDCGNDVWANTSSLLSGHTKSCGCILDEDMVDGTRVSLLLMPMPDSNTSGFKNVYYDKRSHSYVAKIEFKKKAYSLGYHETAEQAYDAVQNFRETVIAPFLEDQTYGITKTEDGYKVDDLGVFESLEEANNARFKEAVKKFKKKDASKSKDHDKNKRH